MGIEDYFFTDLKPVDVLNIPHTKDFPELQEMGLPNSRGTSDHFPIGGIFEFFPEQKSYSKDKLGRPYILKEGKWIPQAPWQAPPDGRVWDSKLKTFVRPRVQNELKKWVQGRRMAQREFSNRRDSPVMVRLLEEIIAAQNK